MSKNVSNKTSPRQAAKAKLRKISKDKQKKLHSSRIETQKKAPKTQNRPKHIKANGPTIELARHDSYGIFGRNAIEAALKNPKRKCYQLFYLDQFEEQAKKLASLRPDIPLVKQMTRDSFQHHVPTDSPHQGLLLDVAPLAATDIHSLDLQSSQLLLILDQVTDPQNVGACLRAGAALGATALVTPDRHCPHESGTIARIAAGGLETLPWIRIGNLASTLQDLKGMGFWVIGLDGDTDQNISDIPAADKIALVMGSEGKGMRPLTKKHCDSVAKIPMTGAVESLNVATAAAIAVYESSKKLER